MTHDRSRTYTDTGAAVFALATPKAASALAVIRITGKGSIGLVSGCFSRPEALRSAPGYLAVHGWIVDFRSGEKIDEVLALVLKAPRSASGEDGVEIGCHGSIAVIRRIEDVLEACGLVPALPGEFTFRAFVNGKLDLPKAEALNELIVSRSEASRRDAMGRLEGGLSRTLIDIRSKLLGLIADTEALLDHGSDIDIGAIDNSNVVGSNPDSLEAAHAPNALPAVLVSKTAADAAVHPLAHSLHKLAKELSTLSDTYSVSRLLSQGIKVAIAGRPNAGKSSLFNALLRQERAIVSPHAGTTRDWIEETIEVEGIPLRLIDTAGLRTSGDAIEVEGVNRAHSIIEDAELVVYLVDACVGVEAEDEAFVFGHGKAIVAWSKVDLDRAKPCPQGFVPVSAATGSGIAQLLDVITKRMHEIYGSSQDVANAGSVRVGGERQKVLIDRACAKLEEAMLSIGAIPLDMIALNLKEANSELGELLGEISGPEVLDAIFSRFCLGK